MTNHAHELELVTSTPRTSSASAALSAHLTTYSSTATPSNQPAPPLASPTAAVHFSPKTLSSTRRKGAEKLLNFLNDALASHKPARLPEFVKHLKDHISGLWCFISMRDDPCGFRALEPPNKPIRLHVLSTLMLQTHGDASASQLLSRLGGPLTI